MSSELIFTAPIRLRTTEKAPATWHFVTVPKELSDTITKAQEHAPKKRGRKSVKVEVHIGFMKWRTSIFPSKELGVYILPLKKEVRKELRVGEGDEVSVLLSLV